MLLSVLAFFGGVLTVCSATMFAFVAFLIVREHGGRFLSSGMLLWRLRRPCTYVLFTLYSKIC